MNTPKLLTTVLSPPFTVLDGILDFALKNKDTKMADYVYKTLTITNRLEVYIQKCVSDEIQGTLSEQTAFRLNSKTTRLMNIIYLNQGIGFLYHCLTPLFNEILEKKIKLKPLRLCKNGDPDLVTCARLVNLTFQKTFSNIENCPIIVRRVLRKVYDELSLKFPQSKTSWVCLGAFIFLRYICPAIIQPLEWGLAYEPPTDMADTYMQISVVMQKVANVKHSDVDDPVGRLTDMLVESKKMEYFNFVTELASVPYETKVEEYTTTTQQFNFYLGHLQHYYREHSKEIMVHMSQHDQVQFVMFEQMNFNGGDVEVTFPRIVLTEREKYFQSIKSERVLEELIQRITQGKSITAWDLKYLQHCCELERAVSGECTKDLVNARFNSYFPGIVTSSNMLIYHDDYSQ
ncbi:hypothetical protein EIN_273420 [Entamoeba invadens IP1]|uniref:Ras-GAP domain-containing protein n=1 Tax=Entamoeba invadens IP1 TaxID=370355 RepID=A0A0A1U1A9_ENTIV|nr:hypothetical protein EIN_273420 [Entamoeba invadens IP1]ELP87815.1 hypothetical protein EIN_273420 [Entamoeba invadens IP1]|eukprot:XP_004254586.1 hypothetical protein EIN_273420 [Entamoeba invadens IP1]